MLTSLASSVIALLTEILPTIGGASPSVGTVIAVLTQLIPVAVQEGQALVAPIKGIIAALSAGPVTAAELTTLQALDAQVDAAFEAAAKAEAAGLEAPISKFFKAETLAALSKQFNAAPGDLIVFVADDRKKARKILGALRLYIAKWKNLITPGTFHFSWVTDIEIKQNNVVKIMRGGRARWKIENETFNTLKNQGYEFEHNFGRMEVQRMGAQGRPA